jgi:hypothetical protein
MGPIPTRTPPTRGFSVRPGISDLPEKKADPDVPRGGSGAATDPDEAVRVGDQGRRRRRPLGARGAAARCSSGRAEAGRARAARDGQDGALEGACDALPFPSPVTAHVRVRRRAESAILPSKGLTLRQVAVAEDASRQARIDLLSASRRLASLRVSPAQNLVVRRLCAGASSKLTIEQLPLPPLERRAARGPSSALPPGIRD